MAALKLQAPEAYFCEILFLLKTSGYLCLARDIMEFASNEFEYICHFRDLLAARSAVEFRLVVEHHFVEFK